MKKLLVLGCTGSIGSQTLDIVRAHPGEFYVCGLAAGTDRAGLDRLCAEFACPGTLFAAEGIDGIRRMVASCGADIAVNGIAGAAGLEPSVIVLEQGIDLALANKETVVMAWPLVKELAVARNACILPVDSEHSALFVLSGRFGAGNVSELVITASGGPFREYTTEQLQAVTVEQALHHPTWRMGPKITIDSATLANKGLEVIEACRLFDMPPEQVSVVVHPQSLVHSLVRTRDGMLYAQISDPDMRHPILAALRWPQVTECALRPFSLAGHDMTFRAPRTDDFPLLRVAYGCAAKGKSYTIAFNAANEVAVHAFLERRIGFLRIAETVAAVTDGYDWSMEPGCLQDVWEADARAREYARQFAGGAR